MHVWYVMILGICHLFTHFKTITIPCIKGKPSTIYYLSKKKTGNESEIFISWVPVIKVIKKVIKTKGLCHIVALPFTLKKKRYYLLRQKRRIMETQIFHHAKVYNLQKILKKKPKSFKLLEFCN